MKLKYSMLNNLKDLTNKEFDLLLFIARFQDEKGNIESIYYKDVCREMDMCKQSFYNALAGLERKGVIRCRRTMESDYNIRILNNDFSLGKEDYQKGYVMLNRRVFRSKLFKKLKAKEKYLLLRLMQETCRGAFKIGRKRFYDKFRQELGVSMRVVRRYLHSLREFFAVQLSKGIYRIKPIAEHFQERDESGRHQIRKHQAGKLLRQAEYKTRKNDVKELAELMRQYESTAAEQGLKIGAVIRQTLFYIQEEQAEDKQFRIKLVHKLVKKALTEDGNQ